MIHFDRERALDNIRKYLRNRGYTSRYILLDAPAGYGKTHLLEYLLGDLMRKLRREGETSLYRSGGEEGIPPDLHRQIATVLQRCPEFEKPEVLRSIFADQRISIWRNELREASSLLERVTLTIDRLWSKRKNGENALLLLLEVLRDRRQHEDAQYHELSNLIDRVGWVLEGERDIEDSGTFWRHINFKKLNGDFIEGTLKTLFPLDESKWQDVDSTEAARYIVRGVDRESSSPQILLILDSVERLSPSAKEWLFKLLSELDKRTIDSDYQEILTLRVILSGRGVQDSFWQEFSKKHLHINLSPKEIHLEPLSHKDIFGWVSTESHEGCTDHFIKTLAKEIYYRSGGHPAIVQRTIEWLRDENFAVRDDMLKEHIQEELQLFAGEFLRTSELSKPPWQDAWEDTWTDIYKTLSVFRHWDFGIVEYLQEHHKISAYIAAKDILERLVRLKLCERPDKEHPFYRDDMMRRVIFLDAQAHEKEKVAEVNRLAIELYKEWILDAEALDKHKASLRDAIRWHYLRVFIEWFYHSLLDDVSFDDLRKSYRKYLEILMSKGYGDEIGEDIEREIRGDEEIEYLLNEQYGKSFDEFFAAL